MESPGLCAFQIPFVQFIDGRVGKGDQVDLGRIHMSVLDQVLDQTLDRFCFAASRTCKDQCLVFLPDNGFSLGIIEFLEEIGIFSFH